MGSAEAPLEQLSPLKILERGYALVTRDDERDGISGVVERLLIEERRRMIDAQLGWITYARAELRAVRPGLSLEG